MSDTVIRIDHLFKHYRLGSIGAKTLRADLNRRWAKLRGKADPLSKIGQQSSGKTTSRNGIANDELWALKDISFEVKQGEVLGIIGRNGAGKSTLLKILSRVTAPTGGEVKIKGRIASLLEVGTGFHPELTGRENTFLNGAILGMTKAEIRKKFDEIVAFSGVEQFIDTPVKRYSSGMYVRLAFAVAAHLDPEILVVDEVLAVGDAQFQKKCLGKMNEVAKAGRTVLFVSHNMDVIARLCPRTILLASGQLNDDNASPFVITKYLSGESQTTSADEWIDLSNVVREGGSGEARFVSVKFCSTEPEAAGRVYAGGPLQVTTKIHSDQARSVGSLAITLYDMSGFKLVNADTISLGCTLALEKGLNVVTIKIKNLHLKAGTYLLGLWLADPLRGPFDYMDSAGKVEVLEINSANLGRRAKGDGVVTCDFEVESSKN
jgi:lipopolysaccharide transport system ATP-binding protein